MEEKVEVKKDIIGKTTDAKVLAGGRGRLNGTVIEFLTTRNINTSAVVIISCYDSSFPFNVVEIELQGDLFLVRAQECGYWCNKLDKKDDLDLRKLVNLDVELITDKEQLSAIREQSCWC